MWTDEAEALVVPARNRADLLACRWRYAFGPSPRPPDGTDPGGAAGRELFKIDLTFVLLPTDPTELAGLDHEARVRVTACEWPLTLPLHAEAARLARSRYTPIDSKNASKLGQPPRKLIHHSGKSPLNVTCVTALSSAASLRPKR